MKRGIVLTLILAFPLASTTVAHSAPGDARLLQGTLEWPAAVAAEPFVVIRAEDGRWYYLDVASAQRLVSGPLTAGTRIAVVGIEGARPHEIIVVALGTGDAAALALALTPRGSGALPVQRAVGRDPVAPLATPRAPAPPIAEKSPSPGVPAPIPPAPPSKAVADPGPAAAAGKAPASPPSTPEPPATTPIAPTPAPPAATPAPPASAPSQPQVPKASAPGSMMVTPVRPAVEPDAPAPAPAWPAGNRWSMVEGTIKVVDGKAIVLKLADGQLVLVDVSGINPTALIKPGSAIAVYGHRSEHRFEAVGVVESEREPAVAKPATGAKASAPSRR